MGLGAKPIYLTKTWNIDKPFFAKFKKHYCNNCNELLKIVWITHFGIRKGSIEDFGKRIRYDIFNHPIDYKFAIFECPKCKKKLSINDQYFIEKPDKLKKHFAKYGDYRLKDDYYVYLANLEKK